MVYNKNNRSDSLPTYVPKRWIRPLLSAWTILLYACVLWRAAEWGVAWRFPPFGFVVMVCGFEYLTVKCTSSAAKCSFSSSLLVRLAVQMNLPTIEQMWKFRGLCADTCSLCFTALSHSRKEYVIAFFLLLCCKISCYQTFDCQMYTGYCQVSPTDVWVRILRARSL